MGIIRAGRAAHPRGLSPLQGDRYGGIRCAVLAWPPLPGSYSRTLLWKCPGMGPYGAADRPYPPASPCPIITPARPVHRVRIPSVQPLPLTLSMPSPIMRTLRRTSHSHRSHRRQAPPGGPVKFLRFKISGSYIARIYLTLKAYARASVSGLQSDQTRSGTRGESAGRWRNATERPPSRGLLLSRAAS